jgi:hypothetical protein
MKVMLPILKSPLMPPLAGLKFGLYFRANSNSALAFSFSSQTQVSQTSLIANLLDAGDHISP